MRSERAAACGLVCAIAVAACGGRSSEIYGAASAGASDAVSGGAALEAGASNAGSSGSGEKAGDGNEPPADDAPASNAPPIELVSNMAPLAVFVGTLGIYLVSSDDVYLFDHQGKLLLTRELELTAQGAAFEEERLIILSSGLISTYDAQVQILGTFPAPGCATMIALSKQRVVCEGWVQGFTVFDSDSGAELQRPDHQPAFPSQAFSRVPGSDDFVLGSADSQQSSYALYRLTPDNHVVRLDETSTPRVGWDGAFGFDGSKPPALISESGHRLGLNPDCAAMADRSSAPCFLSDTPSSAIPAGLELAAIAPGPTAHQFFGLVGTPDPNGSNACHIGGCDIELIDSLDGRVRRQRHIEPHSTNVTAFLWDARAHAIVLSWASVASDPADYRSSVMLIPF